jgi:serine/threonine protein kinase/tetratricopeptide (TPR) repeat protein
MTGPLGFDDDLARRLPLPLAQLYRRAHNAKSAHERHQASLYLWEAGLKLLGSVAVVEYADRGQHEPDVAERLQNLARPSLGQWWEIVRRLLPILANTGDQGFCAARDLLLGRARDDLPRAAGLDAALCDALDGQRGARATIRLSELFDRLVRYRNRTLGHGAAGLHSAEFYERMGRALLAGVPEVFGRLDALAGRQLVYIFDVRRQPTGNWLIERYCLQGETDYRMNSLESPHAKAAALPQPQRLYLMMPGSETCPPSAVRQGGSEVSESIAVLKTLHPLLLYEPESKEVMFLNTRRGSERIEYLSYSTSRNLDCRSHCDELRQLLGRVLGYPIGEETVSRFEALARAQDEEMYPLDGGTSQEPGASRRLGEFELLSELGRGGMGVVYRAWQPSLGRQVALKALLRSGDPEAEVRFAREIHVLGRVEHPHLVKVFTSGSEGASWFYSMELIEGATLAAVCEKVVASSSAPDKLNLDTWRLALSTTYDECRRAEKPIATTATDHDPLKSLADTVQGVNDSGQSLMPPLHASSSRSYVRHVVELLYQVADAAHALHQAGVVHRDIKPGNIMLTADGAQVVLMDLGLAQLIDESEQRLTRTRQFVGTLRYASPEQLLATVRIDRRSDVYSLGATIWELLTLRPMFGATEETPTPEVMRRIQFKDPESVRKYNPAVPSDLDAVVLKCLEKDPDRRYATARGLADDLQRYLVDKPVAARRVGEVERAWRWSRRNPLISGMLATLLFVILGSLVGVTLLYLNAEHHRHIAEHQEAGARAVSRFYEDSVLAAPRPQGWEGGMGKDVTMKEALNKAEPTIDKAFSGQPEMEANVRYTLGSTYWYIGQFDAAYPQLEKAYAIRLERLGPDHPDTLTSLDSLAMERWKQDRFADAVALERQALERRRRVLGPEHEDTLRSQINLAQFLTTAEGNWEADPDQFDEAATLLDQAIAVGNRVLGANHRYILYGQMCRYFVLEHQGKSGEGLALARQTYDGRRRVLGPDHPDTLRSMADICWFLEDLGKFEDAERQASDALAARIRILGDAHFETFDSRNQLAIFLVDEGKMVEAEKLRREALKDCQRLRGADDPQTLNLMTNLGQFLGRQGKLEEAVDLIHQAVEASRRTLGPEHRMTLSRQSAWAQLLAKRDNSAEAEALYRQTFDGLRRVRGPEHTSTLIAQGNLAAFLSDQGTKTGAEALYREIVNICLRTRGPEHKRTLAAQANLADILNGQGKSAEAEKLFRSTLQVRERVQGQDDPDTVSARENLAEFLEEHGERDEAKRLYRQQLAADRKLLPPGDLRIATRLALLGRIVTDCGQPAEAEPLLRECVTIREKKLPQGHWQIASARCLLGASLAGQRKFSEAELLLLDAYDCMIQAADAPPERRAEALARIIALYEWEKPEEAKAWQERQAKSTK